MVTHWSLKNVDLTNIIITNRNNDETTETTGDQAHQITALHTTPKDIVECSSAENLKDISSADISTKHDACVLRKCDSDKLGTPPLRQQSDFQKRSLRPTKSMQYNRVSPRTRCEEHKELPKLRVTDSLWLTKGQQTPVVPLRRTGSLSSMNSRNSHNPHRHRIGDQAAIGIQNARMFPPQMRSSVGQVSTSTEIRSASNLRKCETVPPSLYSVSAGSKQPRHLSSKATGSTVITTKCKKGFKYLSDTVRNEL